MSDTHLLPVSTPTAQLWRGSTVSGACVAIAWLLVSLLGGLSFLGLLQSQPTGEHWFSPDDNGVNPSLDETIGFVASFFDLPHVQWATRVAKLIPSQLVCVEVIGDFPASGSKLPTVGDRLP